MSIESGMPSNHLILCHHLLLCLQSFPASVSFLMSQFVTSGGHSIGVSASASVLPVLLLLLLLSHFSRVQLFVNPWTAAQQASLSNTNSQSLLKLMSIESGMPSNHLIICHPLFLLPSIFPSIWVFSRVSSSHQVARALELQPEHQSLQ